MSMGLLASGVACSDDGDDSDGAAPVCSGGGGPVASSTPDTHCQEAQQIGLCVTSAATDEEAEAPEEEEFVVRNGREADDDDCKYHVEFENTCIALNQPATFTLKLTRKEDGQPGAGAVPKYPEVYFADDPSQISPTNDYTASEGPPGTYRISPFVFNRPGRWVVRFHYFEECSDIPEDAPHGHAAFYIDVPAAVARSTASPSTY
jgi:hypothetical protein